MQPRSWPSTRSSSYDRPDRAPWWRRRSRKTARRRIDARRQHRSPALCGDSSCSSRRPSPPDIIRLPVPAGLTAVVVHPDLEIETATARILLGDTVPPGRRRSRQWANLGALVDSAAPRRFRADGPLARGHASPSLVSAPRTIGSWIWPRSSKCRARGQGALGCSLSGSGPSLFALCRSAADAERVASAMSGGGPRAEIGGELTDLRVLNRSAGRSRGLEERMIPGLACDFVTTQGRAPATSLEWALFDGLAPDGSLYMPESIDPSPPREARRPAIALARWNSAFGCFDRTWRRRSTKATLVVDRR